MSNIEWTDTTWNPLAGCTPVSPGCLNCYAATMARRLEAMGVAGYEPRRTDDHSGCVECGGTGAVERNGIDANCTARKTVRIAEVRGGRAVFTGDVRLLPDRLTEPLKWRKPRMVFVNSMSDLFHEAVPFEFVDRVFAVMALCPQHTFQVLTKRPERMALYMAQRTPTKPGHVLPPEWLHWLNDVKDETGTNLTTRYGRFHCGNRGTWPLPNVWLGTSVEDQRRADERIPHLLRCPAAVRFLSCEPLLGEIDLSAFFGGQYVGLPGDVVHPNYNFGIGWVIVGGESGPNARTCDVEWIRSIVRQCKAAGVRCFVKQLGSRPIVPTDEPWTVLNRKGGDPAEWPADLRVREMPERTTTWEK